MLRSLISNPAKTTSHTCMAFIPSLLSPAQSFALLKHTHSMLCAVLSRSNHVLFSESKSPCGFVTVETSWSWEQDCYCLIPWKKSVALTGLSKKKRKNWTSDYLCRQNSLIPPLLHLTLHTCTISKQWQIWNIQHPHYYYYTQQKNKKTKPTCACSLCTLLILRTWWLLVQIGPALHSRSRCLWSRGCICNEFPLFSRVRAKWKRGKEGQNEK